MCVCANNYVRIHMYPPSSDYSSSTPSAGAGGKKYGGFGSDTYFSDGGRSSADESPFDSPVKRSGSSDATASYRSSFNSSQVTSAPYQQPASAFSSGSSSRQAGQVGGSWGSVPAPSLGSSSGGGASSFAPAAVAPTAAAGGNATLADWGADQRFGVERRLVDELTATGGMRAQPAPELLSKFARQSQSLTAMALIAMLIDKLHPNRETANTHLVPCFTRISS
jgi:hypothetical protein